MPACACVWGCAELPLGSSVPANPRHDGTASSPSSAPTAVPSDPNRSRLVVSIELDDVKENVPIKVGDDVDAIAARFSRQHGVRSHAQHHSCSLHWWLTRSCNLSLLCAQLEDDEMLRFNLVEELRKALVQSYELELDFVRRERDGARRQAAVGSTPAWSSPSSSTAEHTALKQEVKHLREQLATAQSALHQEQEARAAEAAVHAKALAEAEERVTAAAAAGVSSPSPAPVPAHGGALTVSVFGSPMQRGDDGVHSAGPALSSRSSVVTDADQVRPACCLCGMHPPICRPSPHCCCVVLSRYLSRRVTVWLRSRSSPTQTLTMTVP